MDGNTSMCSWEGVNCTSAGRVSRLALSGLLEGTLPSEVGQLAGLTYLHLDDIYYLRRHNSLSGTLPPAEWKRVGPG